MKQKALYILSLVIALVGGVMAIADKFNPMGFLPPQVAQYWPVVLVVATVIDRVAKLIGDALDNGKLDGSFRLLAAVLLAGIMSLFVSACTVSEARKAQIGQTGAYVANKVSGILLRGVLHAAVSATDRERKVDFAQGLAEGLRAQEGQMLTSDDVEELVRIWTPENPHWEALAKQVAALYAERKPQTVNDAARLLEEIALGIDRATAETNAVPVSAPKRKCGAAAALAGGAA